MLFARTNNWLLDWLDDLKIQYHTHVYSLIGERKYCMSSVDRIIIKCDDRTHPCGNPSSPKK